MAGGLRCSDADWHVIEIDVRGKPNAETGAALHIHTVRRNPSSLGRVTGSATLASFVSSMLRRLTNMSSLVDLVRSVRNFFSG